MSAFSGTVTLISKAHAEISRQVNCSREDVCVSENTTQSLLLIFFHLCANSLNSFSRSEGNRQAFVFNSSHKLKWKVLGQFAKLPTSLA